MTHFLVLVMANKDSKIIHHYYRNQASPKKSEEYMLTKKFGPRYGRKVRERFSQVEDLQRGKHKCPYCNKLAVKRLAIGIWHCTKCDAKFTGKAYTL